MAPGSQARGAGLSLLAFVLLSALVYLAAGLGGLVLWLLLAVFQVVAFRGLYQLLESKRAHRKLVQVLNRHLNRLPPSRAPEPRFLEPDTPAELREEHIPLAWLPACDRNAFREAARTLGESFGGPK